MQDLDNDWSIFCVPVASTNVLAGRPNTALARTSRLAPSCARGIGSAPSQLLGALFLFCKVSFGDNAAE
jgi:hypothetical protein